jgi:hypothetical protein
MKNYKILHLFMAVLMFVATSASAALAVCHAPCCMPGAAMKMQEMKESGDCCGHSASTEAEAAAFFADDYVAPQAVLASDGDDSSCHFTKIEKCVAELHRGGEYVTHNLTIQLDAPEEAFSPVSASPWAPGNVDSSHRISSGSPPGVAQNQPLFLQISSFLC